MFSGIVLEMNLNQFSHKRRKEAFTLKVPQHSHTLLLDWASLQRIQNSSDSNEQGGRVPPETFIFLAMLVWQKMNFIGGTNSTEPLPKMWLHIFSLGALSPPIRDFPVALKARSGDGQIE